MRGCRQGPIEISPAIIRYPTAGANDALVARNPYGRGMVSRARIEPACFVPHKDHDQAACCAIIAGRIETGPAIIREFMHHLSTYLNDVLLFELTRREDSRGFFQEAYRQSVLREHGVDLPIVQANHTGSHQRVLRGLHYQIRRAQGKLVRVVVGEVFDVAVDLRETSSSFGQSVGTRLSAGNRQVLWIPPGFAHGFYTVSDWAEVLYLTTDYYAPEHERTLLWNDPALGIDWPLIEGHEPILSDKDAKGKPLSEADTYA